MNINPEDLIPFYGLKEKDQEDLVEEQQEDTASPSWPETRQDNDQDRDFERMDKHYMIQKSMPPQNFKLFN